MAETYSGVLMIDGEIYFMHVHYADTQYGIFLWFEMQNRDSIKGVNQN